MATAMTRSADEAPLSAGQAMQFIQQSGNRLIAILNGPGDVLAKTQELEALIQETIDVAGIARFSLGSFWNSATEGQRDEYVRLFPALLVSHIGKAFGAYRGIRFSLDRAIETDDTVRVSTTVFRPDYSMQVTWIVATARGATKIIDVVAGGFSMRVTQRDDCVSLLKHDNASIQALIETLRQQAATVL